MKKIIITVVVCLISATVHAENIKLKTGKNIEGAVVEAEAEYIKVDTGDDILKIRLRDMAPESRKCFEEVHINAHVTIPGCQEYWDTMGYSFETETEATEIWDDELIEKKTPESPFEEHYENGALRMEGIYKYGYAEGIVREYYPGGESKAVINLKKGKQHGERKDFYTSGAVKRVCNYENGVLDGTCEFFDKKGSPTLVINYKDEKTIENQKIYYEDGSVYMEVDAEGTDRRYYKDGSLKFERTSVFTKYYDKEGFLRKEAKYVDLSDGRRQGDYVKYDKQGKEIKTYSRMLDDEEFYYNEGEKYEEAGDLGQAFVNYKKAYDLSPWDYRVNMAIGTLYYKTGKLQNGIYYLRKAAIVEPERSAPHIAAGVVSKLLGEYEEAEKFLLKAIELAPDNVAPLFELADTYAFSGKKEEAIKYYNKVVKVDPDRPKVYLALGGVFREWGDYEKVRINIRKAKDVLEQQIAESQDEEAKQLYEEKKWMLFWGVDHIEYMDRSQRMFERMRTDIGNVYEKLATLAATNDREAARKAILTLYDKLREYEKQYASLSPGKDFELYHKKMFNSIVHARKFWKTSIEGGSEELSRKLWIRQYEDSLGGFKELKRIYEEHGCPQEFIDNVEQEIVSIQEGLKQVKR